MRRLALAVLLTAIVATMTCAQSGIDAEGTAIGTTVLWFAGTEVTLRIESELELSGILGFEDRDIRFEALGLAIGEGAGDSGMLTLDAWLLLEAVGITSEGDPITLRGGLSGTSSNADLASSALGSAEGPFFIAVTVGTQRYTATGIGAGGAGGTFVVPDDPLTMQMEGTATYTLVGDLTLDESTGEETAQFLERLPWDTSLWPDDLLETLLGMLAGSPLDNPSRPSACEPPAS